ncbi:MAG: hypothetical protein U5K30_06280 [Acidimicrobiales bacterium]|nr:hypothetical protein [Acidimicrobiales bacterium]
MTASSATAPSGAVYDRGYRPFEGTLGGRRAARAAVYRASLRRAVGLRRSWRQKLFPWFLLAVASVPAVVWVGVAYITRGTPAEAVEIITYREYLGVSTALLVFVAFAAPDVLCPDRRHRTLPLYFARPLTGTDYAVAKVGAIATLVFAFSFLPQVVLYVGQLLVSDGAFEYFGNNLEVLWKIPVATVAFSAYFSLLACAIASLTTRRIIAAATLLILLLGSSGFAAGLSEASGASERPDGFQVELDEDGVEGDAPVGTGPNSTIAPGPILREYEDPSSAWGAVDLLDAPMHVRDLVFEGEVIEVYLAGVDGAGLLAVSVYLLVVMTSAGTLWWRYRWVEP